MDIPAGKVGCIIAVTKDSVVVLGLGTIIGEEPPILGVNSFSKIAVASDTVVPKILLESDEVVYGSECWWFPESTYKNMLEKFRRSGKKLITIGVKQLRSNEADYQKSIKIRPE